MTRRRALAGAMALLAISYEPEVLRARARGLPVIAVAALVWVPLTAIVSLPAARIASPSDLRGKRVATAGIDYQSAYLDAVLRRAGVPRASVTERNAGFDLLPALLGGRADAVLGAYWNYEAVDLRRRGRDPHVIRIEAAGVPTYDELVVVARARGLASRRDRIVRFLRGLRDGTHDLAADPHRALGGLLKKNRDLDPKLQRASVAATLPYLLPKAGRPYGFLDPAEWQAFTRFMQRDGLLPSGVRAGDAFTDSLLG
ncbi:MAG: ABC transporter substrate-binding protein [Thermoleophilaceae bacterium]